MAEPKKFYPTATIAQLLLMDVRNVQKLGDKGVFKKHGRNKWDLQQCVQGYIEYLKNQIPGNASGSLGHAEINVYKVETAKNKAEVSKIELMEKKKELLLASEVENELKNLLLLFKTNMRNIAERVAVELADDGVDDEHVRVVVQREIDDCLLELSKGIK